MFKRVLSLLIFSVLLALAGCAGFGGGSLQDESGQAFDPNKLAAQDDLPKFSAETAGNGIPNGWNFYRIAPYKKNTVYRLENYQGRTVLSANSKTSASGLAVKLRPRQVNNLWLQWEWKALSAIPEADNSERYHDDAPLRILVAFDGNKSKLDENEINLLNAVNSESKIQSIKEKNIIICGPKAPKQSDNEAKQIEDTVF